MWCFPWHISRVIKYFMHNIIIISKIQYSNYKFFLLHNTCPTSSRAWKEKPISTPHQKLINLTPAKAFRKLNIYMATRAYPRHFSPLSLSLSLSLSLALSLSPSLSLFIAITRCTRLAFRNFPARARCAAGARARPALFSDSETDICLPRRLRLSAMRESRNDFYNGDEAFSRVLRST